MDTLAKAKAELSEIEKKFQALVARRDALQSFVALGESLYTSTDAAHTAASPHVAMQMQPAIRTAIEAGSMKDRVETIASEIIAAQGPTKTTALVAAIEGCGVEISGQDKLQTVSAILSRSGKFTSSRSIGWSLISQAAQKATPIGAGTPMGVSSAAWPFPTASERGTGTTPS